MDEVELIRWKDLSLGKSKDDSSLRLALRDAHRLVCIILGRKTSSKLESRDILTATFEVADMRRKLELFDEITSDSILSNKSNTRKEKNIPIKRISVPICPTVANNKSYQSVKNNELNHDYPTKRISLQVVATQNLVPNPDIPVTLNRPSNNKKKSNLLEKQKSLPAISAMKNHKSDMEKETNLPAKRSSTSVVTTHATATKPVKSFSIAVGTPREKSLSYPNATDISMTSFGTLNSKSKRSSRRLESTNNCQTDYYDTSKVEMFPSDTHHSNKQKDKEITTATNSVRVSLDVNGGDSPSCDTQGPPKEISVAINKSSQGSNVKHHGSIQSSMDSIPQPLVDGEFSRPGDFEEEDERSSEGDISPTLSPVPTMNNEHSLLTIINMDQIDKNRKQELKVIDFTNGNKARTVIVPNNNITLQNGRVNDGEDIDNVKKFSDYDSLDKTPFCFIDNDTDEDTIQDTQISIPTITTIEIETNRSFLHRIFYVIAIFVILTLLMIFTSFIDVDRIMILDSIVDLVKSLVITSIHDTDPIFSHELQELLLTSWI